MNKFNVGDLVIHTSHPKIYFAYFYIKSISNSNYVYDVISNNPVASSSMQFLISELEVQCNFSTNIFREELD